MTSGAEDPGRSAGGEPDPSEEALRRLEERLDRASDVAERLIVEAAARVAQAPVGDPPPPPPESESESEPEPGRSQAAAQPPPAGWQRRGDGPSEGSGASAATSSSRSELDVLLQILAAVRDRIPPELQHRLAEALREVLLAIRALIDWYLERTERRRAESVQVEDIPII